MKHIQTVNQPSLQLTKNSGGCGECQASCQSACSTKGYDNPQIVLLETKTGCRIDVEVQVADAYGYDIQCQVVCEKGTVNLPDPYAVVKRANATRSFPILTDWKDRFIEAYDIELTQWIFWWRIVMRL